MKKGMSTTLRIVMVIVILIILTFVLITIFTHQTGSFLHFARTTTTPETGNSGLCRSCLVSYCSIHSPDTSLTDAESGVCQKVCSGVDEDFGETCKDLLSLGK